MRLPQIASVAMLLLASHAANAAVESLKPQEVESGIVTTKELSAAEQWFKAVQTLLGRSNWVDGWISASLPFHFTYKGQSSASLLPHWQMQKTGSVAQARISWTDPESGLRVTWQARKFDDFPAAEWMLTLENTGSRDTGIIEDIQDLNLSVRRDLHDRALEELDRQPTESKFA